jgi:antitoxin ParD1/3/4
MSDYLNELIQEEEKRRAQERLDGLILEGLDSGDPIPADAGFWAERCNELLKRRNLRRKGHID